MVGGTVADLFRADDRGLAMNVFGIMVFAGQVGRLDCREHRVLLI